MTTTQARSSGVLTGLSRARKEWASAAGASTRPGRRGGSRRGRITLALLVTPSVVLVVLIYG